MTTYWDTKWSILRISGAAVLGYIDLKKDGASPSDMYVLQNVTGLEPPEIDVSISKGKFQARQVRDRVIVVTMGLNPDYLAGDTPSDLRAYLYGMLTGDMYDASVTVFLLPDPFSELFRSEGYVSKIEPTPFAKDQSVQITINCLKPYFHDFAVRNVMVADSVSAGAGANIQWPNVGSAPSGFHIKATFGAAYDSFEIQDAENTQRKMKFDWFTNLGIHGAAGDYISFDTQEGQRYAILYKSLGGGAYDAIDLATSMTSDSVWLELHNNINMFHVTTPSITWNEITYLPLHWGI